LQQNLTGMSQAVLTIIEKYENSSKGQRSRSNITKFDHFYGSHNTFIPNHDFVMVQFFLRSRGQTDTDLHSLSTGTRMMMMMMVVMMMVVVVVVVVVMIM